MARTMPFLALLLVATLLVPAAAASWTSDFSGPLYARLYVSKEIIRVNESTHLTLRVLWWGAPADAGDVHGHWKTPAQGLEVPLVIERTGTGVYETELAVSDWQRPDYYESIVRGTVFVNLSGHTILQNFSILLREPPLPSGLSGPAYVSIWLNRSADNDWVYEPGETIHIGASVRRAGNWVEPEKIRVWVRPVPEEEPGGDSGGVVENGTEVPLARESVGRFSGRYEVPAPLSKQQLYGFNLNVTYDGFTYDRQVRATVYVLPLSLMVFDVTNHSAHLVVLAGNATAPVAGANLSAWVEHHGSFPSCRGPCKTQPISNRSDGRGFAEFELEFPASNSGDAFISARLDGKEAVRSINLRIPGSYTTSSNETEAEFVRGSPEFSLEAVGEFPETSTAATQPLRLRALNNNTSYANVELAYVMFRDTSAPYYYQASNSSPAYWGNVTTDANGHFEAPTNVPWNTCCALSVFVWDPLERWAAVSITFTEFAIDPPTNTLTLNGTDVGHPVNFSFVAKPTRQGLLDLCFVSFGPASIGAGRNISGTTGTSENLEFEARNGTCEGSVTIPDWFPAGLYGVSVSTIFVVNTSTFFQTFTGDYFYESTTTPIYLNASSTVYPDPPVAPTPPPTGTSESFIPALEAPLVLLSLLGAALRTATARGASRGGTTRRRR